MLKSLKRSIQFLNKDQFDRYLYKVVCNDDLNKPKDKHINLLIECLKGENFKVLPMDAFTRITDQILAINFSKWANALKWCYVLHIFIYSNCNLFVEGMCTNGMFTQIKQHQGSPSNEVIFKLHLTLAYNYFNYIQNRYENLHYFVNAMEDFDQKEETQKSLIIFKILHTIQLILKVEKELDMSIQRFPEFPLIKQIGYLLLRDLTFFYPIATQYVTEHLDILKTMEPTLADKIYQNYVDLIRVSRHVKQMMLLKPLLTEGMATNSIKDIKVFSIDIQKNQDIELHFTNQRKQNQIKELDINKELVKQSSKESSTSRNSKEPVKQQNSKDSQMSSREAVKKSSSEEPHPSGKRAKSHNSSLDEIVEILEIDKQIIPPKKRRTSTRTGTQEHFNIPYINIQPYQEEKQQPLLYQQEEPDRIRLPSKCGSPPQRTQRRQPQRTIDQLNLNSDAASQRTTTTQHSFLSEYSEGRVMGIHQNQGQGNNIRPFFNKNQNDFYIQRDSPLGFISFNIEIMSQQHSSKDIVDEKLL